MCSLYVLRNFISVPLRNITCELTKPKNTKFPKPYFGYSSRQYSELKPLSSNEFELSDSLNSSYKIDFQAVTEGNKDKMKALELLLMKLELKLQQGTRLPRNIYTEHWRTLLTLSDEEMLAFFQYRLTMETLSESEEKERIKDMKYFENTGCLKGIFDASILERITYLHDFKSLQAMQNGPHIIIDCGFEKVIPRKLIWTTAFNMFDAWQKNRSNNNPSHIIFCNLNPDGEFFSLIMEMLKDTNQDAFFSFSWTKKSYLELFPRENLIYLTPESKNIMQSYNGKKNYIIGGLSEHFQMPVTQRKAKLEEIQTAQLPVDEYVNCDKQAKLLSVCNCVNLLNDLKEGCNWNLAFRHVPKKSWSRHALDENQSPRSTFRSSKPPKYFIRENYRSDFKNKILH